MKKTLLLIVVAGLLLATGISGYLVTHRASLSNGVQTEAPVVSKSEPAVSAAVQKDPDAEPRMAAAKVDAQQKETVQVVAAPDDRFQPFDETSVLDQRITSASNDRKKRELLIKTSGKYPFRRIEETLVKNEGSDTYTISARTEMVADHVLVKLQDGRSEADLQAMLKGYGVSILRALSLPGHYIVSLKAPTLDAVPEAVSVFGAENGILFYVEPDYIVHASVTPNDTRWSDLWGMVKVNATGAWDTATGSTNVVVAVIDSGIDISHPDLASNIWINAAEAGGTPGVDDDGNGFIDDTNGWNFVSSTNNPSDDNSHGTHCAGTIGAVGNNDKGVAGVCWTVRLMALKFLDAGGSGLASDGAEAVRYAADKGAKIISASYGGGAYSDTERDAIVYANSKGVLFVAAAGNDSADNDAVPHYPSSYDLPNIVSVAATDQHDAPASFSNYGRTSVDLAAPGVDIVSTIPGGTYASKQGTSMATPHVAGAAALMLSAHPSLTHLQVKEALLNTVDKVPALAGKTVSGGRLNVKTLIALQDSDNDGMPDDWEIAHGLNPNNPNDALLDPDNDHLNNRGEYENRCITTNADTDADTLWDGWEVRYGFNPNSTTGGLASSTRLSGFSISGDSKNIAVVGNYAYVAAGAGGLIILNISNPERPSLAGSLDTGNANDVAVTNGYAYVADDEKGLVVVDVSNPTSPFKVGSTNTAGTAQGVAVRGNYAYFTDGTSQKLLVFDVSNPAAPRLAGMNSVFVETMQDVFIQGDTAYIASMANVRRISLSNPTSLVANATVPGGFIGMSVKGVHGNSSVIAAVMGMKGVTIMNTNLVILGSYDTDGTASGVFVDGSYVYVADGTNGLVVLDVSNPSAPVQSAHIPTTGTASGVFVSGGNTYVTEGVTGMEIFSILPDSDGDGLLDSWEKTYFGNLSQGATNDVDGDGISNWGEYLAGLNPTNSDQDADGLNDGLEVRTYNTDPRVADTDGDGLNDGAEVSRGTNPLLTDTDGDGMPDGWEVRYGFDPLDVLSPGPSGDADHDGLTNLQESQNGTDPNNPDTDGDSMPDGWEVLHGLSPTSAVGVDGASGDPDSDKLLNLQEYSLCSSSLWQTVYTSVTGAPSSFSFPTNGMPGSTDPQKADSDGDGLTDYYEITTNGTSNLYITNPNNADTDGDGLPDKWELGQTPISDPTVPAADSDDSDGDGLTNGQEKSLGTQPTNKNDPIYVDDDGAADPWPGDPTNLDYSPDGSRTNAFDAIQEAVDVATNGMTVLINSGTYLGEGNYNINPNGKAITIKAWSTNAPGDTIINSLGHGPVFVLNSGETTNTVIKGLGITVTLSSCSDGDCDSEHAIALSNASPQIVNCRIFDAQLDGIHCENNSSPIVRNCTVSNVLNGVWCSGGSSPRIENCNISDVGHDKAGSVGIGVYINSGSGVYIGSNSVISRCNGRGIVIKNSAGTTISDTDVTGCSGGITCDNSSPLIERCIISGNASPNYYTSNNVSYISRSLFDLAGVGAVDVTDDDENGGGILLLRGSSPLMVNCLVVSNQTWAEDPKYPETKLVPDYGLGGGFYIGSGCSPTGVNCTVADNHANTRGGGLSSFQSPLLRNMVFWGNTSSNSIIESLTRKTDPTNYPNLHCRSGSIDIWYSDVQYGYPTAVLSTNANPLFVGGGDYGLRAGSPCINQGTFYLAPLLDLDGNQRPTNLPLRVDMGCYEYGAVPPAPIPEANLNATITSTGGAAPDPLVDSDYFRIYHQQSLANGTVLIAWQSVSGKSYVVQSTDNLINGVWSDEAEYTNCPETGDVMTFSAEKQAAVRYYRVLVRQP